MKLYPDDRTGDPLEELERRELKAFIHDHVLSEFPFFQRRLLELVFGLDEKLHTYEQARRELQRQCHNVDGLTAKDLEKMKKVALKKLSPRVRWRLMGHCMGLSEQLVPLPKYVRVSLKNVPNGTFGPSGEPFHLNCRESVTSFVPREFRTMVKHAVVSSEKTDVTVRFPTADAHVSDVLRGHPEKLKGVLVYDCAKSLASGKVLSAIHVQRHQIRMVTTRWLLMQPDNPWAQHDRLLMDAMYDAVRTGCNEVSYYHMKNIHPEEASRLEERWREILANHGLRFASRPQLDWAIRLKLERIS